MRIVGTGLLVAVSVALAPALCLAQPNGGSGTEEVAPVDDCNACGGSGCNACGGKHGRGFGRGGRGGGNDLREMPQSCYQPHYGCYPAGSRWTHRYPAFHGYYYRRPYNYRNLFDYPWHARMHEPASLFSYRVPEEAEEVDPDDEVAPPPAIEPPAIVPPAIAPETSNTSVLKLRVTPNRPTAKVRAVPVGTSVPRRVKALPKSDAKLFEKPAL